ncbi:short chain dehydrogenase [Aureitalea marina]|uniref:Short chain dehydrogenase n=1 Tax=Aureitalea marina TaxID=930804 RepID=A0A2S7KQY9_9FLAO|nr:short chain dehydrogenase [Aureitalea marina]PQB05030.1 short chain dehydrogenase [Aureitalea marina]
MKKVIVIGGAGTIGKVVTARLKEDHEVIVAGRNSGDIRVDIADSQSIEAMFREAGQVDAVVNVSGEAKWDHFDNLSEEDYYIGIRSKMMGQVNLVRIGKEYLKPGGSITLTTGILADDPVLLTTSAAMVNGAIHSFVRAVVLDRPDIRVNAVSAGLVADAFEKYKPYFPGHDPVPMEKVANGYVKCVDGQITGQVVRVMA